MFIGLNPIGVGIYCLKFKRVCADRCCPCIKRRELYGLPLYICLDTQHISKMVKLTVHDHRYYFIKHMLSPSEISIHLNQFAYLRHFCCTFGHGLGTNPLIYFDLRNASDTVPHNVLLHELSNPAANCFHSCLSNRWSSVRISVTLSFSYLVKSGVLQGST